MDFKEMMKGAETNKPSVEVSNFDKMMNSGNEKQEQSSENNELSTDLKDKLNKVSAKVSQSDFLKEYIGILNIDFSKLSDATKSEVNKLLDSILKTTEETIVLGYLTKLQGITDVYNSEKGTVAIDTHELTDKAMSLMDNVPLIGNLFSKTELQEIRSIDIDGNITSIEEFSSKLESYKRVITKTSWFQKLSKSEQQSVYKNIDGLKNGLKKGEETSLGFLNAKFNDLGKQIDGQTTGTVEVTLENGETLKFKNQEEAYYFVLKLKESAELEFQGTLLNLAEGIGGVLLDLTKTGIDTLTYPVRVSLGNSMENMYNNLHEDTPGLEWTLDTIFLVISFLGSVNYAETLYRRGIVDVLAMTGVKHLPGKSQKLIRIPDYEINKDFYSDPKNVELRNEYIQRVNAINLLEEEAKIIVNQSEKIAFEKELKNVKAYLNVNTDTFWLKALSLQKGNTVFGRLVNVFINSPKTLPTGITLRDRATRLFNLNKEAKVSLRKGLSYVFESSELLLDDNKVVGAEGTGVSDNIKNIYNYINARSDLTPEQKKKTIKRLDDFIKGLKIVPRGTDYIKAELLNIAKNDYLSKDDISGAIEKKLEEKYPFLKNKGRQGTGLNGKEKFVDFTLSVKEKYSSIPPASLTKGDVMLYRFAQIVENGQWKGNQADLNAIFDRIDDGRMDITQEYGSSKLALGKDVVVGSFNRYGLTIPELNTLRSTGQAVSLKDLDELLEIGEEYGKDLEKGLDTYKGDISKNLQSIFNLDTGKFPIEKEKLFEDMYTKLGEDIKNGKISITGESMKLEIVKMYNGYLPNHAILNIISGTDYGTKIGALRLKDKNVADFVTKIETGKWFGTLDDLKAAYIELSNGNIVAENIVNFNVETDIDTINKQGIELEKLNSKNRVYGLPISTDGHIDTKELSSTELRLVNILNKLNGNVKTVDGARFNGFMDSIEKGVDFKIDEFYEELNKSLGIDIELTGIKERSNYLEAIGENINPHIRSVTNILSNPKETVDVKNKSINDFKYKFGMPIGSITDDEIKVLRLAGVEIDNLLEAHNKFLLAESSVQAAEVEKVQKIENLKEEKLKVIDEKISYLQNLDIPTSIDDLKDLQSDLKGRKIYISLKIPTIIGSEKEYYNDNIGKINGEIDRLETEKMKLNTPIKYFNELIKKINDQLRSKGLNRKELIDEISALKNDKDINIYLDQDYFDDDIYRKIESKLTKKIKSMPSFSKSDFTKAVSIFDAIKKNGFKVTR